MIIFAYYNVPGQLRWTGTRLVLAASTIWERDGTMSAPIRHSLRVVVQHVPDGPRSSYRLIAYSDNRTYEPMEFSSIELCAETIRSVAPDFDKNNLSVRVGARETYIAFAGEMELDESQISGLGLKDGRRS